MPILAGLAVVFAGISGQQDHRVEMQLRAVAAELHVMPAKLSAADLATIGHHGEGARDVIQRMHADGVIAGEYVKSGGQASVRLIVYGGDGSLRSLSEIPLTGRVLAADALETVRANLEDEVSSMAVAAPKPAPAPAPKPLPVEPEPVAEVAPPMQQPQKKKRIATKPTPPPVEETEAPTPTAAPEPTTTEASESVSVAEMEAMTAESPTSVEATATPASESELHLRAAVGLGIASRSFTPGPTTLPAYASSAVGVVRFAAGVQPTQRIALSGIVERSLSMSTPLDSQMAPTSFSRWELTGDYALVRGAVEVMPMLGLGHRAFSIDSVDPSRSPAMDYSYAVLGARAAAALGSRVSLHGHVAFEPVLSGSDTTAMAFGSATRWAMDVGAAVEIRAYTHVFARVAADYQRFAWSWDQVGARGAGGAVDGYPSGTISLGADY